MSDAGSSQAPILVTGANGQVGIELIQRLEAAGLPHMGLDLPRFDLTDSISVLNTIEHHRPDLVINLAAYTAVDKAESHEGRAGKVNTYGAGELAIACARYGAQLIHVSTDYVFDGKKGSPYREDDAANPINAYGRTKWLGEQAVRQCMPQHIILRTSWVFGAQGANFVKTILRLAAERDELGVVADQLGCPTPAADIAETLLTLGRIRAEKGRLPWGTYHYAGQPDGSWHDFASAIVELSSRDIPVNALTTEQFPTPASRPADTRLDCSKIETTFGIAAPEWRLGLKNVLTELGEAA